MTRLIISPSQRGSNFAISGLAAAVAKWNRLFFAQAFAGVDNTQPWFQVFGELFNVQRNLTGVNLTALSRKLPRSGKFWPGRWGMNQEFRGNIESGDSPFGAPEGI